MQKIMPSYPEHFFTKNICTIQKNVVTLQANLTFEGDTFITAQ